jgi:hypothetical protein
VRQAALERRQHRILESQPRFRDQRYSSVALND